MGFLSDEKMDFLSPSGKGMSWRDATAKILGSKSSSENVLTEAVTSKTAWPSTEDKNRVLAGLRWIGIFSDEPITPKGNPLDTLCATLETKMQYEVSLRSECTSAGAC